MSDSMVYCYLGSWLRWETRKFVSQEGITSYGAGAAEQWDTVMAMAQDPMGRQLSTIIEPKAEAYWLQAR